MVTRAVKGDNVLGHEYLCNGMKLIGTECHQLECVCVAVKLPGGGAWRGECPPSRGNFFYIS